METAMVMEKMYYIIDGKGNYYRMNEEDQLIVSQTKETADLFDLKEANKRINNGRKMYFYSILPADTGASVQSEMNVQEGDNWEENVATESHVAEGRTTARYSYELEQLDWKEYLTHFSYVVCGLKKYQDKLNNDLSEVDMCICDLMHYLELYDLGEEEYIKAAGMIKEYREKRRIIKDTTYMVECFQKAIGTNANLAKAKEAILLIDKLDRRIYKPRVLSEIFTKTLIPTKRKDHFEAPAEEFTEQKGETMEVAEMLERRETVFDNGENDWGRFVAEQVAFFADAKQYAVNLQLTLNELDEEIEQVLYEIEESNCNAAQGYQTFKRLKELRMERTKVAKELECVQTITQCFDCEAMYGAYRYCEERIGEM